MTLRRRELLVLLAAPGAVSAEVMLAQVAPAGMDPTGYLVSEKFDGVRALWDGQVLRFRSGRRIEAPAWFLQALPATPLDGELWMGRGRFDDTSAAVRRAEPRDEEWRRLQYLVFELPAGAGRFDERVTQIAALVRAAAGLGLQAVEQRSLASNAELRQRLRAVVQAGGEGLMLHRADAPVTTGRTDVLLKLKPLLDAEATVVGHVPGKGKNAGQLGALEVEDAAGKRFKLGTGFSEAQRRNPPALGSRVTYTYRDLTPSGKPRFASFLRMADEP